MKVNNYNKQIKQNRRIEVRIEMKRNRDRQERKVRIYCLYIELRVSNFQQPKQPLQIQVIYRQYHEGCILQLFYTCCHLEPRFRSNSIVLPLAT